MKSTCMLAVSTICLAGSGQAMPHMTRQDLAFDASKQAVSVSGEHAWQAPGPDDMRGPCPALNSLANHGYIPRNGFVSIPQAINALEEAFGVSQDLGAFFAVLGAVIAGDGLAFSIGGPPPPNLIAGGLLGQPLGISNAHNRFEGDASPTRQDKYISGDAATLQLPQVKGLLELAGDRDELSADLLYDYGAVRYNQSVFNNPYFFKGLVGFVVPPATYGFAAHVFSNKSAEHPNGYFSRSTFKSFFGVTGDDDDLQFTPGHERFPDLFYKYGPLQPYSIASIAADVLALYAAHPETAVFGGNTGTTNSMTGVDLTNLTGGVYNSATLLEGDNLGCFTFQTLSLFAGDIIANGGVINDVLGTATSKLRSTLGNLLSPLSCPQLEKFDDAQLSIFPGYTKFDDKTGDY